jgi:hypothetical protein
MHCNSDRYESTHVEPKKLYRSVASTVAKVEQGSNSGVGFHLDVMSDKQHPTAHTFDRHPAQQQPQHASGARL